MKMIFKYFHLKNQSKISASIFKTYMIFLLFKVKWRIFFIMDIIYKKIKIAISIFEKHIKIGKIS